MKYTEIQELSIEELAGRLVEERANLRKLRFAHALSALENPMKLKATRKLIAQLATQQSRIRKNSKEA